LHDIFDEVLLNITGVIEVARVLNLKLELVIIVVLVVVGEVFIRVVLEVGAELFRVVEERVVGVVVVVTVP